MDVNYKLIDTERIQKYIFFSIAPVSVESLLLHSGADSLRIYPALFELEQSGWLEVVEREAWGAPKYVRKKEK